MNRRHLRKRLKDWQSGLKRDLAQREQKVDNEKSLAGRGNMGEGGQRSQRASNTHPRALDLAARQWGITGD